MIRSRAGGPTVGRMPKITINTDTPRGTPRPASDTEEEDPT